MHRLVHLRAAVLAGAAFGAGLAAPKAAVAETVLVFAAASMKNGLDAFAERWEAETGHNVTISYAGSNALAKQILAGAPADVFVSANVAWMDEVEKAGLVAEGDRKDLLGNTLVLIAHGPDAAPVAIAPGFDLAGLLGGEKLAMALVDAVPAGQYGKAALSNLGVWEAVAPSVAQADNVRSALFLVSTGEAPYGIVYATDAAADADVTIVGTFPEGSYPAIVYPAALLESATDAADAAFFEALSDEAAAEAFGAEGFKVLD